MKEINKDVQLGNLKKATPFILKLTEITKIFRNRAKLKITRFFFHTYQNIAEILSSK